MIRPAARWQTIQRVPAFERFFAGYVRRLLARSFATVWLRREAARLPDRGYVAVANHGSWWDGFVPFALHSALAGRPFALLMSDAELRRFPFFRWTGAFSIDSASPRRARPAIAYAAQQVRAGAGVWIFPEGVLHAGSSTLPFSSGFVHAARRASAPIIPVALRFALLGRQRPEAFVDIGAPLDSGARNVRTLAESAVREQLARIDRDILEGWSSERYVPFVRGVRGIDERVATFVHRVRR